MPMHIALLGASKGIGAGVLRNLLAETDATATLLLRKPVPESDEATHAAIKAGRVRVVSGDATRVEDVERTLEGKVDVVLTSVGGAPHFTLTRGFQIDQPTLCTDATLALLSVLQRRAIEDRPRVVVVSSMGIGPDHGIMPLPLRIMYSWLLAGPHKDKEGLEYMYQRAGNFPTPPSPPAALKGKQAAAAALPEAFVPEVIIVRPALLTDGAERGLDNIKVAEDAYVYTISRADVARFITDKCLPGEDEWVNKTPVLGYK